MLTADVSEQTPKRTGHSKALRLKLRAAREERGWTQQDLANRIGEYLSKPPPSIASISMWEGFDRHPSIDTMAAWARVLGMRLVVECG